jgi:competence protein ComEA
VFGRSPAPDSDAVALARRRLAELAAHFETTPSVDTEDGHADVDATANRQLPSAEAPGDQRDVALTGARRSGRHLEPRAASDSGRWQLSPQHITVVALLLAAVLAAAAWMVLRSTPSATPVKLANQRTVPSGPGSPSPPSGFSAQTVAVSPGGLPVAPAAGSPSATGLLVVDVAGKVKRPGIVELPAGSRVYDALRAAGGTRPGARTTALNLARPLVDGEQIVVGLRVPAVSLVPSPEVTSGATPGAVSSVDLNTATEQDLESLPGIGPVTAAAILQWRTENGAFTSVDQLLDVSGIGEVTLANLRPYVHV